MITVLLLSVAASCQTAAALLAFRLLPLAPRRLPCLAVALAMVFYLLHLLLQLFQAVHASSSPPLPSLFFQLAGAFFSMTGLYAAPSIFTDHRLALQLSAEQLEQAHQSAARPETTPMTLETLLKELPEGLIIADASPCPADKVGRYGLHIAGSVASPREGLLLEEAPQQWPSCYMAGALTEGNERPLFFRACPGETMVNEKWFLPSVDGRLKTVLVNAGPLFGRQGEVIGGITVWHDISELAEARRQAEEERFRLRSVLENLPVGVWIMHSDGSIAEENKEAQRLWGGQNPALAGVRAWERCRGWWLDTGEALCSGDWPVARAVLQGERVVGDLVRIQRFDGRSGVILNSAVPLYNQHGDPLGAVGVFFDVTEQQESERKSGSLSAELEAIFRTIAEGVVLYDSRGEVLRFNPAAQAIFNYSAEEWRRPLDERLSWGFKRDSAGQPFSTDNFPLFRALRGEVVHGEIISFTRTGENTLWLTISAAPVLVKEEQILGAVITYGDFTRTRQLQQENQGYMHTITHDLRNPLAVVLGHAEMLHPEVLRSCAGELPRINIESILLAGKQMEKMMEDLVDLAGLEGGAIHLQQEAIPLTPFLKNFLARAQVYLDIARIRLDLPVQEAVPWVDPKYLERFLNNLLSNALKYSSDKEPVLLRVGTLGDQVLVSVVDRGQGIPAEDLPHIFERFYRAGNAKGKSGLGLGLYITRLLVEAHGGRIWAESSPGRGSTFYLALPQAGYARI
jgi:PAS domain S-box-containing protein